MPQVPVYGAPRVQEEPIPGVRAPVQAPLEAFGGGAGLEAQNRATQRLLGIGQEIALQEKKKADSAVLMDADSKLSAWETDWFYNPKTGARTKKLKDAQGLPDQLKTDFKTFTDSIESSFSNEIQKQGFKKLAQARFADMHRSVSNYAGDQGEKFGDISFRSALENERNAGANRWSEWSPDFKSAAQQIEEIEKVAGPISDADKALVTAKAQTNRVQDSIERQHGLIYGYAAPRGLLGEWSKREMAAAESSTHRSVVIQMLRGDQDLLAKKYYDKHSKAMLPDDRADVLPALNAGSRKMSALEAVNAVRSKKADIVSPQVPEPVTGEPTAPEPPVSTDPTIRFTTDWEENGKPTEREIPLIVEGMSPDEVEAVLAYVRPNGPELSAKTKEKIVDHAKRRIRSGKDPFPGVAGIPSLLRKEEPGVLPPLTVSGERLPNKRELTIFEQYQEIDSDKSMDLETRLLAKDLLLKSHQQDKVAMDMSENVDYETARNQVISGQEIDPILEQRLSPLRRRNLEELRRNPVNNDIVYSAFVTKDPAKIRLMDWEHFDVYYSKFDSDHRNRALTHYINVKNSANDPVAAAKVQGVLSDNQMAIKALIGVPDAGFTSDDLKGELTESKAKLFNKLLLESQDKILAASRGQKDGYVSDDQKQKIFDDIAIAQHGEISIKGRFWDTDMKVSEAIKSGLTSDDLAKAYVPYDSISEDEKTRIAGKVFTLGIQRPQKDDIALYRALELIGKTDQFITVYKRRR